MKRRVIWVTCSVIALGVMIGSLIYRYTHRPEAKVEVVATLIGYVDQKQLPSGETVPKVIQSAEKISDASGFLFSVLQPKQYQGYMFMLHHDGIGAGDPATLFQPDMRYRLMVRESSLARLPDTGCSLEAGLVPNGKKFVVEISSPEEARKVAAALRSRARVIQERLNAARSALEAERTRSSSTKQSILLLEVDYRRWSERQNLISKRIETAEQAAEPADATDKPRPNKSPEPTPTAVTPRATEGKAK